MRRPAREEREIQARNRLIQRERERSKVDPGNSCRHEIAMLAPEGCIGLECGVDTGQFTERLWNTGRFSSFHAVDKWDDVAHPEAQYWAVAEKLMPYEEIRVWRMAVQTFATMSPKGKFGFIYMDCYAHTAQDAGGVLDATWPLLAEGGLFAGDDYDEQQWPDNYRTINDFAGRVGRNIRIYDKHMDNSRPRYDTYPSWYLYR